MKNLKKKYSIKVPKNIKVFYCDKKNLIWSFNILLLTKKMVVTRSQTLKLNNIIRKWVYC